MKNLFKNDNALFRQAVGTVSDVFQIEKMEPVIAKAERKLRDMIGATEYNNLITAVYNSPPGDVHIALLALVRGAVGRLALVYAIPEINVSVGPGGLLVKRTDNTAPASQYRTEQLIRAHRLRAYELFDDAIEFMEQNTAVFTDYAQSAPRQKRRSGVIITPGQFQDVFGHKISHVVFHSVLPTIRMHEKNWLARNVGTAFYLQLVAKAQEQADGDDVAEAYTEVLRLAQEAVAHHAMTEAIPNMHVRINEDGVTLHDDTYNSHTGHNRRSVQPDALSYLVRNANENAQARMADLVGELNDKASATVFPEFFESEHYFDPEEEDWREDLSGGYFGL